MNRFFKKAVSSFAVIAFIASACAVPDVVKAESNEAPGVAQRIEVIDFNDVSGLKGAGFSLQKKNARFGFENSALWKCDVTPIADYHMKGFRDWSDYDAIVLTLYSNKASKKQWYFRYMSEWNYNQKVMAVNWEGWASVIIPFGNAIRDKVSYIRFAVNNAADGIFGQELSIASVRLIDSESYNFYDSAFGYEVHDEVTAVLGDAVAVCEDSENAIVKGKKIKLGSNGEKAIACDEGVFVPAEFVKSLSWENSDKCTLKKQIDSVLYVSFEEAAKIAGIKTVKSTGLCVAGSDGIECFDCLNKLNPHSACAVYMIKTNMEKKAVADESAFKAIEDKIKKELTENYDKSTNAETQLEKFMSNGINSFSDLNFKTASDVAEAYSRIYELALLYVAGEDGSLKENIRSAVLSGLEYLHRNHFGDADKIRDTYTTRADREFINAYIPQKLSDILILMGDAVSESDRERYISPCCLDSGDYENGEDISAVSAKAFIGVGVVGKNAELLNIARGKITERLIYADVEKSQNDEPFLINDDEIHQPLTERRIDEIPVYIRANSESHSGQGIMSDGSYISDGSHGSNGKNGLKLLDIVSAASFLSGTPFELDSFVKENVYNIIEKGYFPFVYNGIALKAVTGNNSDNLKKAGCEILNGMKNSLDVVPEKRRTTLLKMISVVENSFNPDILADDDFCFSNVYSRMDKTIHRSKGYTAALSMFSDRMFDYDSSECRNLNGWYQSGSMMTLYLNGDTKSFGDSYWKDVDPYKLPGTTVELTERQKVSVANGREYQGGSPFTGGVSNGKYSASVMTVVPYDIKHLPGSGETGTPFSEGLSPDTEINLSAKKSWFMFDDEIVALGCAITDTNDANVITTVDNRYGADFSAGSSWAHINSGNGIGYYLPSGNKVLISETQNGMYELWFDHGKKPVNASYCYAMLPGKNQDETQNYSLNPQIHIISNTPQVQAVSHLPDDFSAYVFHSAHRINGISVSQPVALITEKTPSGITLYVSDPSQSLDKVNITLDGKFKTKSGNVISCDVKNAETSLWINLKKSYGQSIKIILSKQ